MSVVPALEVSLQAGQVPTLTELGGVSAILDDRDAVIRCPFFDVLVRSVGAGSPDERSALLDLIIDGILTHRQPTVFRDAVDAILNNADFRQIARRQLVQALQKRIEGKVSDDGALLAAYALEGLFQLSLDDDSTKWATLIILDDLRTDDVGIFAQHAAKIAGLAYHQWREARLRAALARLQANDEAADEVACELAMVAFSDALDAGSEAEVHAGMREARGLFVSVVRRDEGRLDASIHVAVIDLILSFANDASEGLSPKIEILGRLLAERHDQLAISYIPAWLKPRVDREVEWWRLLRLLRKVDCEIRRPSWIEASRVMEQVLAVYKAEQTVAAGDGLNVLLAPRIEAAFIRERGLAAHLNDLLANGDWTLEQRHLAEGLRDQIAVVQVGDVPARLEAEDGEFPRLSTILRDRETLSQVPKEMAAMLELSLADNEALEKGKILPDVQRICARVSEEFADVADYRGEIKHGFDQLVRQVVVFCEDRQHADLAQLGERGAYLRNADAVENHLQRDLREWLRGNMSPVKILSEVPGIATGRTDLYIDFGKVQFVVELKRHFGLVDEEVARTYRAQAVGYQATGPKIGMLGILELVDRSGPPPSLIECVWTDAYVPEGSHLTRQLVVFRVPGMLKTPSMFS